MSSVVAAASKAPVLCRRCDFEWYWNAASDAWKGEGVWRKYTDVENEIIEDAYKAKKFDVKIDGGYIINLKQQVQYQISDSSRQRPVKRIQLDEDRSNDHLREERFSLPVTFTSASPRSEEYKQLDELDWIRSTGIYMAYHELEVEKKKNKTIADVVEEATEGIIKQGTEFCKEHEAQWLAQQLLAVKHVGNNLIAERCWRLPDEIGETCVYLYTKESFWYKLINHVLRDLTTVTREQFNTLGPFCWLLERYMRKSYATDSLIVYRGLELTDEQRQDFMKERITLTSFTSTSRSRGKAEQFGNTLLIIDRNGINQYNEELHCGADISHLSSFPDEEEFLIWPGESFSLIKYEYDPTKKKHIIYLQLKEW